MAYKKQCDSPECALPVGDEHIPFLQIHGSISEQIESPGGDIAYRYLTQHKNSKLVFCDWACAHDWAQGRGRIVPFIQKTEVIHRYPLTT